jgi:TPR repeat protein
MLFLAPAARAANDAPPAPLRLRRHQRGDYLVAMKEAKKRIAANPKDAAALTLIGQLYLEGAGVGRDLSTAMGGSWVHDAGDREGLSYGARFPGLAPKNVVARVIWCRAVIIRWFGRSYRLNRARVRLRQSGGSFRGGEGRRLVLRAWPSANRQSVLKTSAAASVQARY